MSIFWLIMRGSIGRNRGSNATRPIGTITITPDVRGGFFLAQRIAPGMIESHWGRVIWISSQSGLVAIPGQPAYCSTKGAVIQLVRTLGVEWARHGITVNSIAPTFVETKLTRKRLKNAEFKAFVLEKSPAANWQPPNRSPPRQSTSPAKRQRW